MRVYEINLNKEESKGTYSTFYYEPQDIYQSKAGSLFIASVLRDSGTSETQLLSRLASVIKENFFSEKEKNLDKLLKNSLKKGNNFLRKQVEEGDIDWMSGFGFAIMALKPEGDQIKTAFAKVGGIEIALLRAGEPVNIGDKAETEIDPYPLTVFSKVVSGTLTKKDRVLFLNQGVYAALLEKGLLKKIARVSFMDKKVLSRILSQVRDNIEGFVFLADLQESEDKIRKVTVKNNASKKFVPLQEIKKKELIKRSGNIVASLKDKIKLPYLPRIPKVKLPERREIVLFGLLVLFITTGLAISRIERKEKRKEALSQLELIEDKTLKARSHAINEEVAEANGLYLETWQELADISPRLSPLVKKEISSLRQEIEESLLNLNKTIKIEELSSADIPQKEAFPCSEPVSAFFNNRCYYYKDGQINDDWLSTPLPEDTKINSIAIDGHIWFLYDTKLEAYYRGQFKKALDINIFPALNKGDEATTEYDSPVIYILDKERQRVIVLNKETGSIQSQLQLPIEIEDIRVKESTLYLLGNEIYELDLLQLD